MLIQHSASPRAVSALDHTPRAIIHVMYLQRSFNYRIAGNFRMVQIFAYFA